MGIKSDVHINIRTTPKYICNMLHSVQKESANDLRNMQIVKPCGCYAPKVYLYTA